MPASLGEGLAWVVLLFLLVRIVTKLEDIYGILYPNARTPTLLAAPVLLTQKLCLAAYGAVFLVFSKDKISSKQLKKAPDPADLTAAQLDHQVRRSRGVHT